MSKVYDIIDLMLLAERGELRFYEENGYIYVENTKGEAVILNMRKEKRN